MRNPSKKDQRGGKLCAGFEKEQHYLMLAFHDFELPMDADYKRQCLHYIDMREFVAAYQYNIARQEFLKMLHYLCRQLRTYLQLDFAKRTICMNLPPPESDSS
jgi:hypothetical protein